MLVNLLKCGKKCAMHRLVVSVMLAIIIVTIYIYVSVNHPQRKEIQLNNIDVNVNYILAQVQIKNESFKELSEDEMKMMDTRMAERREHVKNYCDLLELNQIGEINSHEFLINDKHHLIWCNVFKAASSSWMYNFNLMAGLSESEMKNTRMYQALAREHYLRPTVEQLKEANVNSTSMIIVRHPFERLSSAYRDKIQNSITGMYADLADEIIKKFRKKNNSVSNSNQMYPMWPTFEEFVRYILDEAENNRELDIHWTPYSQFCTPCHFNFDVIIKFETIEEDQRYLIQKAGLTNVIKPQWKNSGGSKIEDNGIDTIDLIKQHYSQLTVGQMTKLYWLYKQDFLLFNYSASFLGLAKSDTETEDSDEDDSDYDSDYDYDSSDYSSEYKEFDTSDDISDYSDESDEYLEFPILK